jgi:hypothetical protein
MFSTQISQVSLTVDILQTADFFLKTPEKNQFFPPHLARRPPSRLVSRQKIFSLIK